MVPDGWIKKTVEEILSLEYGKALKESDRQKGTIDVYGSNGVIGIHNESWLKAPGIVVGRKGTVGSVVWANRDFWAIDTTYYVNLKDEVELRWVYFMLLQLKLERLTQATGSPGLNRNDVYRLSIAIPPVSKQKRIAEILSSVDEAIASTQAVIDQTRKVKQGLLQQLLTRGIGHTRFKESAIGKIPESWEVVELRKVCNRITVGLATSITGYYKDEGVPLIRNLNIKNSFFDRSDVIFLDPEFCAGNKNKAVKANDVITVRTGANIGLTCLVPEEFDGAQTFTTLITRTKNESL